MCITLNIIFILVLMYTAVALISVVDKGILPLKANSIGFKLYVDVTNEDRESPCNLYTRCKKCCLIEPERDDCDIITAFGEDIQKIKPRDRKTILYVAPVIQKHDIIGHCDLLLNYNCDSKKDRVDITIPFDTRVDVRSTKELMKNYVGDKKVKSCEYADEDSLNNCEPVDCNLKYIDKRPYFNHNLNKCTEAPLCLTNPAKDLPDYVYVPDSNTCRNLELPLTVEDIYMISSGLGTVTSPSSTEYDDDIKLEVIKDSSTISQNLNVLRDFIYGKLGPLAKGVVVDYRECFKSVIYTTGICILSICALLFFLVFCVNAAVWLYIQWSEGAVKKWWNGVKKSFGKKMRKSDKNCKRERVNSTIRNALLREVIVKDIPIELRNSMLDVCDRMERQLEEKKRYREIDVGSQISLQRARDSFTSMSYSSSVEREKKQNKLPNKSS